MQGWVGDEVRPESARFGPIREQDPTTTYAHSATAEPVAYYVSPTPHTPVAHEIYVAAILLDTVPNVRFRQTTIPDRFFTHYRRLPTSATTYMEQVLGMTSEEIKANPDVLFGTKRNSLDCVMEMMSPDCDIRQEPHKWTANFIMMVALQYWLSVKRLFFEYEGVDESMPRYLMVWRPVAMTFDAVDEPLGNVSDHSHPKTDSSNSSSSGSSNGVGGGGGSGMSVPTKKKKKKATKNATRLGADRKWTTYEEEARTTHQFPNFAFRVMLHLGMPMTSAWHWSEYNSAKQKFFSFSQRHFTECRFADLDSLIHGPAASAFAAPSMPPAPITFETTTTRFSHNPRFKRIQMDIAGIPPEDRPYFVYTHHTFGPRAPIVDIGAADKVAAERNIPAIAIVARQLACVMIRSDHDNMRKRIRIEATKGTTVVATPKLRLDTDVYKADFVPDVGALGQDDMDSLHGPRLRYRWCMGDASGTSAEIKTRMTLIHPPAAPLGQRHSHFGPRWLTPTKLQELLLLPEAKLLRFGAWHDDMHTHGADQYTRIAVRRATLQSPPQSLSAYCCSPHLVSPAIRIGTDPIAIQYPATAATTGRHPPPPPPTPPLLTVLELERLCWFLTAMKPLYNGSNSGGLFSARVNGRLPATTERERASANAQLDRLLDSSHADDKEKKKKETEDDGKYQHGSPTTTAPLLCLWRCRSALVLIGRRESSILKTLVDIWRRQVCPSRSLEHVIQYPGHLQAFLQQWSDDIQAERTRRTNELNAVPALMDERVHDTLKAFIEPSLSERWNGIDGVRTTIDRFVREVLTESWLNHLFDRLRLTFCYQLLDSPLPTAWRHTVGTLHEKLLARTIRRAWLPLVRRHSSDEDVVMMEGKDSTGASASAADMEELQWKQQLDDQRVRFSFSLERSASTDALKMSECVDKITQLVFVKLVRPLAEFVELECPLPGPRFANGQDTKTNTPAMRPENDVIYDMMSRIRGQLNLKSFKAQCLAGTLAKDFQADTQLGLLLLTRQQYKSLVVKDAERLKLLASLDAQIQRLIDDRGDGRGGGGGGGSDAASSLGDFFLPRASSAGQEDGDVEMQATSRRRKAGNQTPSHVTERTAKRTKAAHGCASRGFAA